MFIILCVFSMLIVFVYCILLLLLSLFVFYINILTVFSKSWSRDLDENKCKKMSNSPLILNVLVEESGDGHGHECVVPGGQEHDGEAKCHAEQRQRPVVEAEARPPVGRLQEGLQHARQVHKAVTHQEKPAGGGKYFTHDFYFIHNFVRSAWIS